jgi:hypothetical protein
LFSRHWEEVRSVFGALQVLIDDKCLPGAYIISLFKVSGIFAQNRKYVHMSKNIEIVMKNIFYLAINIVCSNDNSHFTGQSIQITMY